MSPLHQPAPHESAVLHVTGRATYVADEAGPPGTGVALPVPSPVASGRILRRDATAARALPGVRAVLFADDLPGDKLWGPVQHTEPLLALDRVHCVGQAMAVVIADDEATAARAAALVAVEIAVEQPILTIRDAIAAGAFHTEPHVITRGDLRAARERAAVEVEGELEIPGQDHFYLETQAALALPQDDGGLIVRSSTQHPTEVQKVVAGVLGWPAHRVVVQVPRMGGGFGGKESQASPFAAFAALGAHLTGRPTRCVLHRGQDMAWTGKRHPFLARYRAAFAADGRLLAFESQLTSDGGWTLDLSGAVMDRALFHSDGAYHLPACWLEGRVARTHLPSNTAFRGFGGPQGMLAIEQAMDHAAAQLGIDPIELRRRNLYGPAPRDRAPFGQVVADNRLPEIVDELLLSADLDARRADVAAFNAAHRHRKRGLSLMPVKFGISFTASLLNQAGALVLIYTDGSVAVHHGGTEMGQGLHTKMQAVAADALGVEREAVRVMLTATDKVPNTSATAASSGSDLNGAAVARACATLVERMAPVAAKALGGVDPATLRFEGGRVKAPDGRSLPFADVARACWVAQVSLSATGFYATPGIAYDPKLGAGTPFFYFAYGAALADVEVNGLTGEHRVLRVDILHDVGESLVPTIDRGQIEGAFVQGQGWLTCEELRNDPNGRLITRGPGTYKIPAAGDAPADLRVHLLRGASNPRVIGGSKAVGEPPFMLATAVWTALRQAVGAFGAGGRPVELGLPATPERVLRAIEDEREAGRGEAAAAAR